MKKIFNLFLLLISNIFSVKDLTSGIHNFISTSFESFDNYSDESYEDYGAEESYYEESYEDYVRKGKTGSQASNLAKQRTTARFGEQRTMSMLSKRARAQSAQMAQSRLAVNNKSGRGRAQFDIVITRLTSNIDFDLPFILFAQMHVYSNYQQMINQYLPAGVTLESIAFFATGAVAFKFTTGGAAPNVDYVYVTCNQVPYSTFLAATASDMLVVEKNRYSIADTAYRINYDKGYKLTKKGIFGKFEEEDITVNSYINPQQFQSGIIDVDVIFGIDKERGLLHFMAPNPAGAAAPISVQFSMFVSAFRKDNIQHNQLFT